MDAISAGTATRQPASPSPRSALRLHGHQLEHNLSRAVAAEVVGTFVLVLAITSTAVAAALGRPIAGMAYGSLAVPAAGGLALAVMVASVGHISGAHLNPAVTLGLAVNGRLPWVYVPAYLIAQFGGSVAAAAVTWALYGRPARSVASLAATYPSAGVSAVRVFAAESVVTFVLVLVIVSVATDSRVPRGVAAVAIGAALAAAIVISGPVSGAGVNPARAIGPMILVGRFTDWWAYLAAPIVAGTLAVALYERFLRTGCAPSPTQEPAGN
jgi:aquaporin Z/aquaporin NIP